MRAGVEQLDPVLAEPRVREDFVDANRFRERIEPTGRAVVKRAGRPVQSIGHERAHVRVGRTARREGAQFERASGAVGPGRPVAAGLVIHGGQHRAVGGQEQHGFAGVVERAGPLAGHAEARLEIRRGRRAVARGELRRVLHDEGEATRRQGVVLRESIAHRAFESDAGEVERTCAGVEELDELKLLVVGGVVVNFCDEQVAGRGQSPRAGQEERLRQRGPLGSVEHAHGEQEIFRDGQGVRHPDQGRRRNATAGQTRIGAVERVVDDSGGSGELRLESVRHRAAVLIEDRRLQRRIPARRAQHAEELRGASGEKAGANGVRVRHPTRRGAIVPTGTFDDEAVVDFLHARAESGVERGGSERAVVEEMFVDAVGQESLKVTVVFREQGAEKVAGAVAHRAVQADRAGA